MKTLLMAEHGLWWPVLWGSPLPNNGPLILFQNISCVNCIQGSQDKVRMMSISRSSFESWQSGVRVPRGPSTMWIKSQETNFLGGLYLVGCPGAMFLQQSLSLLYPWTCEGWDLAGSWDAHKASFLFSWWKVLIFSCTSHSEMPLYKCCLSGKLKPF